MLAAPGADLGGTAYGLHVYDGMVLVEKRQKPERFKVILGPLAPGDDRPPHARPREEAG